MRKVTLNMNMTCDGFFNLDRMGADLAQTFMQLGLIDEYRLGIHPGE